MCKEKRVNATWLSVGGKVKLCFGDFGKGRSSEIIKFHPLAMGRENSMGREKFHGQEEIPWAGRSSMGREKIHGAGTLSMGKEKFHGQGHFP